jgi:uncharacterized membrane protein YphA (DoxX/SURF4 family)
LFAAKSSQGENCRMPPAVCRALIAALSLPLALFFAFVGWNKAFAPLADLARHGAWTVHLPEAIGRLVGWSELACALALAGAVLSPARRIAHLAALALIANQVAAAAVHAAQGQVAALPQNAVLVAMLAALAWLTRAQPVVCHQTEILR